MWTAAFTEGMQIVFLVQPIHAAADAQFPEQDLQLELKQLQLKNMALQLQKKDLELKVQVLRHEQDLLQHEIGKVTADCLYDKGMLHMRGILGM